jgi:nicotinate phosphoribosyltransferase
VTADTASVQAASLPRPQAAQALLERAILLGETSDVYFLRTLEVLEAEGLNPCVTLEVFPGGAGILAGVDEALALLERVLPAGSELWAMERGTPFQHKQTVLRIIAPYLSFGIYETAILGVLAQESGWATAARRCVDAAGGIPIASFGARHVHPLVAARMDYAAVVGGCVACSTVLGARLAGVEAAGTMPHALVLIMGSTLGSAEAFDRVIDPAVPRVVLVDTFHDEAQEAVAVANALGERLHGIRLDTPAERGGVTPELVQEVRARLDQAGHSHVRILVSGGVNPERLLRFRETGAPVDSYGIGSYISAAPPIDFTADIKAIEGQPIAKRGRIPGVIPNPALRRVM